ncbi:MAG: hypothetical protein JXB00_17245 [Bacteroidales bacterium]|nr:hypothetical protein [Bacteroidales bacterium]
MKILKSSFKHTAVLLKLITSNRKLLMMVLFIFPISPAICQSSIDFLPVTKPHGFSIQERALLIPDQELYLAGENINFFALTFDAALQIPINLSAVLYTELLNQDNGLVNTTKTLLKKGEGINMLSIPRETKTGYYYLRAYTNYMKNFGPGVFFIKKIRIVNPFYMINYSNNSDNLPEKLNLNFAAEGGRLVYGIENKLIYYTSGFKGRLFVRLFENNLVLAENETTTGWGTFTFKPIAGKNYRIEAVSGNMEKSITRPDNFSYSGVICTLDSIVDDNGFIRILTNNFNKFPLSLLVENNAIIYEYPGKLFPNDSTLALHLPRGLNRIIIKDNAGDEVTDRLIYIKPSSQLEISAKVSNDEAQPGDSVIIHLSACSGDTVNCFLSMNLGNSHTSVNISELAESSLFAASISALTHELPVEEFKKEMNDVISFNNYILRFGNLQKNNTLGMKYQYLPEISHDLVTGRILKKADGSPAVNKIVYQSFIDSVCWVSHCRTNNTGKFILSLPFGYQGHEIVISVKDTTTDYSIELENELYPFFLKLNKENYYPDSSLKDIIEARMLNLQVNDAYSGPAGANSTTRSSLRFYGYPDKEYKFRDYQDLINFEEFAFEIIKEASVDRIRKDGIKVTYGTNYNIIGNNPLFLFDGVPMFTSDMIARIPTRELESVRIVTDKFYFGSEVYDGIIDVTSNSKSFTLVETGKNVMKTDFIPIKIPETAPRIFGERVPGYKTCLFFNSRKVILGSTEIKLKLPQNTGNFSLNIFGISKSGEWGSFFSDKAISINYSIK